MLNPAIANDTRLDSAQALYFSRQLEFVKGRSYDVKYAELRAALVIPVSTEAGSGAQTITYRQYDMIGAAQVIANYAKDFKRVSIVAKEFTAIVKSIGDSYGFTVQDIRSGQMAGVDLEQREASAAVRGIAQTENTIAFFGDADNNLGGFFSNPNVPKNAAPADGALSARTFASKTPDQIIRDVSKLINDIRVNTKDVERADTVLMPLSILTLLQSTPRSSVSDTSILDWLKTAFSDSIKNWVALNELETAGVDSSKMMVAYKKDPEKLTLEIPQPFEQFPPQMEGLEYTIVCHERIGGVIIYYPLSVNFVYGI